MDNILIVEDTFFFSNIIQNKLGKEKGIDITIAQSLKEAIEYIDILPKIDMALLDLNLPDAPNGEIVEEIGKRKIPFFVFTGTYDEKIREKIIKKGAIDYIVKDNPSSLDYLVSSVRRVRKNKNLTALVVEDSNTARKHISGLLKRFQLNVLEAEDGQEGIETFKKYGDNISIIITDYQMPNKDGFQLIKEIRKNKNKNETAIIGLSASGQETLSAKFIKSGANDFLSKPFIIEELFCRVTQNLDALEYTKDLHNAATKDYLTGINNRRYFYELAAPLVSNAKRNNGNLAIAMFDIDNFKSVNDTYGHDVGDEVLKAFSKAIDQRVREEDIFARIGGEEFCLLLVNPKPESIAPLLETILKQITDVEVETEDGPIHVTASIGVSFTNLKPLEEMIRLADLQLYKAKHTGKNRAQISFEEEMGHKEIALGPEGVSRPYVKK